MDVEEYEAKVAAFTKQRDANPQQLCRRPDCDHEQADHDPVLLMKCGVSDCDCEEFVTP